MADFRVQLNDAEIRGLMSDSGLAGRAAARAAGRARDRAKQIVKQEGRVDTGKMMQSIESEKVSQATGGVTYRIGSRLEYAGFQHEGTNGPIVPRQAKVLRFKPKGARGFVFRPSVSGVEGIKFLTRALDDLSPRDFR